MNQLPSVQKRQCLQDGRQQFLQFLRAQRPPAKDLRECLVAILHHDKLIVVPARLIPAHLEQLDQVRVGQVERRLPTHQQALRVWRIRPDEFDRGFGEAFCLMFGKEDRAVVGPAKAAA